MKLGTFVGKQGIMATEAEKKYVEVSIKKVFEAHGIDCTFEWDYVSDMISRAVIKVPSIMDGGKHYRNGRGDLVAPKYIHVVFGHEAGYDEAEWGPVYARKKEGEPTLDLDSYHFKMDVMGDERPYRCKNTYTGTGLAKTAYSYGTELIDLEVETNTHKILRAVESWVLDEKTKWN